MGWSKQDEKRIKALREKPVLSEQERLQLRELRRRETVEAFKRRKAYFS